MQRLQGVHQEHDATRLWQRHTAPLSCGVWRVGKLVAINEISHQQQITGFFAGGQQKPEQMKLKTVQALLSDTTRF